MKLGVLLVLLLVQLALSTMVNTPQHFKFTVQASGSDLSGNWYQIQVNGNVVKHEDLYNFNSHKRTVKVDLAEGDSTLEVKTGPADPSISQLKITQKGKGCKKDFDMDANKEYVATIVNGCLDSVVESGPPPPPPPPPPPTDLSIKVKADIAYKRIVGGPGPLPTSGLRIVWNGVEQPFDFTTFGSDVYSLEYNLQLDTYQSFISTNTLEVTFIPFDAGQSGGSFDNIQIEKGGNAIFS